MLYILVTIPVTLFLASLISGCSLAPFSSGHSAHTVEENSTVIQGGLTASTRMPYGRITHGIFENVEIGALVESQPALIAGAIAKYAFINNLKEGPSVSLEGSLGGGDNAGYAYLGPMVGYKKRNWDAYMGARYQYAHNKKYVERRRDQESYGDDQPKHHNIHFGGGKVDLSKSSNFNSALLTVGNTFWLNKQYGVNVNANYTVGSVKGVYAGVGLVYVFDGNKQVSNRNSTY